MNRNVIERRIKRFRIVFLNFSFFSFFPPSLSSSSLFSSSVIFKMPIGRAQFNWKQTAILPSQKSGPFCCSRWTQTFEQFLLLLLSTGFCGIRDFSRLFFSCVFEHIFTLCWNWTLLRMPIEWNDGKMEYQSALVIDQRYDKLFVCVCECVVCRLTTSIHTDCDVILFVILWLVRRGARTTFSAESMGTIRWIQRNKCAFRSSPCPPHHNKPRPPSLANGRSL